MASPIKNEELEREFQQDILGLFSYSFIATYFAVWHQKTKFRERLRKSSIFILILSTFFLGVEVTIEYIGSDRVQEISSSSSVALPIPHIPIFLFLGAVGFLIYHNFKESKKPEHEYRYVKQFSYFVFSRPSSEVIIDEVVMTAIKHFYQVFDGIKIDRCSFYTLNGEEVGLQNQYVYPSTDNSNYNYKLRKGEGVGGKVCDDEKARYVPRLFLPMKRSKWSPLFFFPHAVKLGVEKRNGSIKFTHAGIDTFAFTPPPDGNLPFKSIISVPVRSITEKKCYGVMNFDFVRYDPLSKPDIAMAMTFGLLLGDEIGRLKSAVRQ